MLINTLAGQEETGSTVQVKAALSVLDIASSDRSGLAWQLIQLSLHRLERRITVNVAEPEIATLVSEAFIQKGANIIRQCI